MTRAGFDLDGVLYNFLDTCLDIDNHTFARLNYPKISSNEYRKHFQTKDWKKFYRDLGIKEENLEEVLDSFHKEYKNNEEINLIPGAKEAILSTEQNLGRENIYFITNKPQERIKKLFERDNLTSYLPNVRTSFEGKTKMLYNLATKLMNTPFTYIGDLVSDGEACLKAREHGASNILFYGILHGYAMNLPEDMERFVNSHKEFAKTLNNLQEINKIWSL